MPGQDGRLRARDYYLHYFRCRISLVDETVGARLAASAAADSVRDAVVRHGAARPAPFQAKITADLIAGFYRDDAFIARLRPCPALRLMIRSADAAAYGIATFAEAISIFY